MCAFCCFFLCSLVCCWWLFHSISMKFCIFFLSFAFTLVLTNKSIYFFLLNWYKVFLHLLKRTGRREWFSIILNNSLIYLVLWLIENDAHKFNTPTPQTHTPHHIITYQAILSIKYDILFFNSSLKTHTTHTPQTFKLLHPNKVYSTRKASKSWNDVELVTIISNR
jgi:hypothetical protein